jgi:hypothetical protein
MEKHLSPGSTTPQKRIILKVTLESEQVVRCFVSVPVMLRNYIEARRTQT